MSHTDKTEPTMRKHRYFYGRGATMTGETVEHPRSETTRSHGPHGKRPYNKLVERSHKKKVRADARKNLRKAVKYNDHELVDVPPIRECARGSVLMVL